MIEEARMGLIISNIINENRNSHCRLCLKYIEEDYVRFEDVVSLNESVGVFLPLSAVLAQLLGENVCDKITGLEVVCPDCVQAALNSARFLEKCKLSTEILHVLFQSLYKSVSENINVDEKKSLCILVHDLEVKVQQINKPLKKERISKDIINCSKCDEVFDNFMEVKAHNLLIHDMWTCKTCYETFSSELKLIVHESANHKFKCSECSQYVDSEEMLKDHHDRFHNLHVCKECGKSCIGLDKLHTHEEKHRSKHCCPKCGKTYTTKEFYEKHVELCVNDLIDPHPIRSSMEKSFRCKECDKAYSTQGGLRVHNRFVHGNAKPHVCSECGKEFTAPSYLKVHMIKHTGEKNFKCNICKNKFVSKEALLYHTRRHTGEKPYSCNICNERFVNASARAEHVKFKHVGPTLMCEICSRKFVTSHFLRQHISRHHDPTSKLYYGRNSVPANLPVEQNKRKYIIQPNSK